MKRQKIFITGASGFTGSHISDIFVEEGYEVFGLGRNNEEKVAHLKDKPNFHLVKGDLSDFENTKKMVAEISPDCIVHVSALHSPEKIDIPFPFFEANERGTVNLLEAAKLGGVKKIIYTSSMSVYDKSRLSLPVTESHPVKPTDYYSLTKYNGELWTRLYAESYNLHAVVLRCVGIYGPRRAWGAVSNFIKNALAGESIELNSNINWDIVNVRDVAKATLKAYETIDNYSFEVFNIGSGKEINIADLAKQIIAASASKSEIKYGEGFKQESDFHFYFDITKAKNILHFEPQSLTNGLKDYINSIKE